MASFLLGDLNDYIQPSVECIKPLPAPQNDNKSVQINLNDCLACSGCVTSAETVLVAAQTHHQILEALQRNHNIPREERQIFVYTVGASTRAALARRWNTSPMQAYKRIENFFTERLSASFVVDVSFGNLLALRAAAEEFVQHYNSSNREIKEYPLLSSECPGWICYAEKKQPKLLPYISTVRSPQQIIGALVKSYLVTTKFRQQTSDRSLGRRDVYHVAIMSCYDKKLEASRDEFEDADGVRDVDCVITTSELMSLMEDSSLPIFEPTLYQLATLFTPFNTVVLDPSTGEEKFIAFWGSSGGGYLYYILRHAANDLFNIDLPFNAESPLLKISSYRSNVDYVEYLLYNNPSHEGEPLLSFAAISGFRNIQTFIQKAKTKRISYDYVEIMACPGACLFGGGQPAAETGINRNVFREEMESLYYKDCHIGNVYLASISAELDDIYSWLSASPENQNIIYTSYKSLEHFKKSSNTLAVQW